MKLGEMSFKESHDAEMAIAPAIDTIMADKETQALFDELLDPTEAKKGNYQKRLQAARSLTNKLVRDHFASTCEILAAVNGKKAKEIQELKRADANKMINEMFTDGDLMGFFASSKRLAQAVQSASLQA